jgi:hypothetical protein
VWKQSVMHMKDIFISYRREDSSDVTGRIFDRLKTRFGENRLFTDVSSIPLGNDFRAVITDAVESCQVVLVIIGRQWLTIGSGAARRIDEPADYVHIEVAAALNRQIPVIPVLVENASMPRPADLPPALAELAYRNAIPVRSDPDFDHDIERLSLQLSEILRRPRRLQRRYVLAAGTLAVAIMSTGAWLLVHSHSRVESDAPVAIRFWIKHLPNVRGGDARNLFNNALGAWQAVVVTPITQADSEAEANVLVDTSPSAIADVSPLGPPRKDQKDPLLIRFGPDRLWTPRTFQAASCRMLGHVLGLGYTGTPGQIMTQTVTLESLPLKPQSEDIQRVRRIWGKH